MKSKDQINLKKETNPSISVTQSTTLASASASKTGQIAKIKNGKDTLPVAKTPKRQKSSRFHVTEKVELEKLPNLKGLSG